MSLRGPDCARMLIRATKRPGVEHLREIAEKVRDLARQTQSLEVREELFDLADRLDRMAELGKKTPG
jgi:hypothetical protein